MTVMNSENIDNPDLHLSVQLTTAELKKYLHELTNMDFKVIEDLSQFEDPKGPWVHSALDQAGDFPQTISVYGVGIPLETAIQLAQLIPCQIITDYSPDLKQYQWQLIKDDGSLSVVVMEDLESGGW